MIARRTGLGWLALTGLLTILAISVFLAFPGLDLIVSNAFGAPSDAFPMNKVAFWRGVRWAMFTLTDGLMIATLGLLAVGWASPKFRLIKPAVLGFMSMVYLLVPGFLVNFLFKQHWGRARPRDILEFGGSAHFTPPFTIADQCTGSCSFMSGETSAIFTVATLVIVLFLPGMRPRFHLVAFVIICLIAIVGAGLRVAFGGHFLSDVIFAALLSVAATLALYLLSGLHKLDGPFLAMDGPFRLSADVLNNTQAEPAIIANSQ